MAVTEITGEQVRAARAALDWTIADLKRESGVSAPTIAASENGRRGRARRARLRLLMTLTSKASPTKRDSRTRQTPTRITRQWGSTLARACTSRRVRA